MTSTTSSKSHINRRQLRLMLYAGMDAGAYRFVRNAAEAWLALYRGDIEVSAIYAHALIEDQRVDLALPVLKQLAIRVPEYGYTHKLLWHTTGDIAFSSSRDAVGVLYALGAVDVDLDEMPAWAKPLRDARVALEIGILDEAHRLTQEALSHEPPTPLAAIYDVEIARGNKDDKLAFTLLEDAHQRWPDTLHFTLLLADALIERGAEDRAVALLHEAAANDVGAQVAESLWGDKHPYGNLFPQDPGMAFELPVPADVAAALGWNQLAQGVLVPSDDTESARPKRQAPSNPEDLLKIRDELEAIAKRIKAPSVAKNDARYPVYVVLTSHDGLERKYGLENIPAIDAAMKRVVTSTQAWGTWGARLIYVDNAASTDAYGIPPCRGDDPWAIKQLLADLDHAMKARGEMIGAVLLVGGPEVIPFHRLPNPVDDDDPEVLSDNPYSTPDENYFIPMWPVGRLPGGSSDEPLVLIKLLETISAHRTELQAARRKPSWLDWLIEWLYNIRAKPQPASGYTAQVWQRASHAVYRPIGKPQQLLISPPMDSTGVGKTNGKAVQLSYYNLHGLEDAPEWYGQRDPLQAYDGPDYPVALRPGDIVNGGRAPQIVYSEACYGANVVDKGVEDAISLKFLTSGTLAMVGSTSTSYGSISPPLIAADLLGKSFWMLLKDGYPVGEALMRAKINLARQMDKRQGYLDGEDQKTLIQFVLYGDPLAQPHVHGSTPKAIRREQGNEHMIETVCDKSDDNVPVMNVMPKDVIKQVKNLVAEELPGMADAKVAYSREHVGCTGHDCPLPHAHAKSAKKLREARQVVTLEKSVPIGRYEQQQYARITLNKEGKVVKVAVSR